MKAFEAAARHGSFARAAYELNVTATAISQHVKSMEHWLGAPLFVRRSNGVLLTEHGQEILSDVTRILDDIAELLPPKAEPIKKVGVSLITIPALSDGWLRPSLAQFHEQNPGTEVSVKSDLRTGQIEKDPTIDFVISDQDYVDPALLSELLFEDRLVPVCTPQYRDLLGLQDPHNWDAVTLLHDVLWEGDWLKWADEKGRVEIDWLAGPRYPNHWLAIEAAKQARGVLMAHKRLVDGDLADGTLVSLAPDPVPTGQSYYLVRRRGHSSPAAIQLRAWLLASLRET